MIQDKFEQIKYITLSIVSSILVGLLIFYTNVILSPILIYVLVVLIYSFHKNNEIIKTIFYIATFVFILWAFNELVMVFLPFILAFLIAYLLNPIVIFLEKKKLPRWLGSLLSIIFLIIIVSLIVLIIIPPFIEQVNLLINSAPDAISKSRIFFEKEVLSRIKEIGMIYPEFEKFLSIELPQRFQTLINDLLTGIFNLVTSASSIVSQIINLILIPILSFYFLKDFGLILGYIKNLFSKNHEQKILILANRLDFIIGGYVRGFLIIALINFVVITTGLSLIGVKYSVVLGLVSALICFIPYFGILIGFLVGFTISALSGVSGWNLALIPVLYFGENLIENMIYVPRIIGNKVGLHPLVILLSLFIFGYFLGIGGMLIAVPTTAFLTSFIKGNDQVK